MSQTIVVQKTKTHISCFIALFFPENRVCVWDNVEKYGSVRQATADIHM